MEIAVYVSKEYDIPVENFTTVGEQHSDAKHVFRTILRQYFFNAEIYKQLGISRALIDYSYNICKTAKFRKSERYQKMHRVAFSSMNKSITVHYNADESKAYMSEPEGIITQKIELVFNNFNKKM